MAKNCDGGRKENKTQQTQERNDLGKLDLKKKAKHSIYSAVDLVFVDSGNREVLCARSRREYAIKGDQKTLCEPVLRGTLERDFWLVGDNGRYTGRDKKARNVL